MALWNMTTASIPVMIPGVSENPWDDAVPGGCAEVVMGEVNATCFSENEVVAQSDGSNNTQGQTYAIIVPFKVHFISANGDVLLIMKTAIKKHCCLSFINKLVLCDEVPMRSLLRSLEVLDNDTLIHGSQLVLVPPVCSLCACEAVALNFGKLGVSGSALAASLE
ncbi:hypothetical protein E2C01_027231 [Portunus trituberculatus]|uniref:Uncharacterized protein n=1 Tax=Portunus trituberculatus TaxID=210409 RepID=A0A5B7EN69_PORTR|nr:hypothetical protein [Portunus trituberculatus]